MRVALVLSGQPRFYQKSYDTFHKGLIERFNADVFFHTWWSPEMVGSLYPCSRHARSSLWAYDRTVRPEIPDELVRLYHPVDYSFDDYYFDDSITNAACQYYSQYAAKLMVWSHQRIEKFQYDLIIRSRFDIRCTQDIPFEVDDALHVPSACAYKHLINDMFSFSNWENFDKVTNTIRKLQEFDKRGMEYAFTEQCMKEFIPVVEFPATWDTFYIYRSKTAREL